MRLEDGLKILALLDTKVRIIVMIRKVMEDIRFAMRQGRHLELVFYIAHRLAVSRCIQECGGGS